MKDSYLKRYPLSHLAAALIIVLSLAPIPEVANLPDVALMDKWVHFVMYGALVVVIWWEYWGWHTKTDWQHAAVGAIALPACMGAGLEVMQEYLTTCRSGEWLDAVANTVGVLLGAVVGYWVVPHVRKGWARRRPLR